jgi:hypothetical protein
VPAPAITALVLTRYPDRAAMLETALASFRAQTFRATEVLIVNDGIPVEHPSPDVRVLNLPSGTSLTIGEKRNLGLREARGEWIAIWDDDDLSLPTRLSELFDAREGGRIKYVKSATMWVADEAMRVASLCTGCCFGTALFHRETAMRMGGFPSENYGEDGVLFHRFSAAGEPWRELRFRSYVHRRHRTNVSALISGESLRGFLTRAIATPVNEITAVQAAIDVIVRATEYSLRPQPVAVPTNAEVNRLVCGLPNSRTNTPASVPERLPFAPSIRSDSPPRVASVRRVPVPIRSRWGAR